MSINPGDRGHVAEHNSIDGRLDALEEFPPGTPPDPVIAGFIGDPASATATALSTTIVTVGKDSFAAVTTPEKYGAVGDGIADDTAAFQAAVDAVRSAGRGTVRLTPGAVYLVTTVNIQEGLTIDGYGATIKRPASQPNWTRTLTNQNRIPASTPKDTLPITWLGFTIDGNLANQGAYSGYELEQASLSMIIGPDGGGRLPFIARDITVTGSVSDGIHILDNVSATLGNITGIDCFRGGIVLTGGNSRVNVDGYTGGGAIVGAHIDMEVDTQGWGGTKRLDASFRNIHVRNDGGANKNSDIQAYDSSIVTFDKTRLETGYTIVAPSGSVTVRDSKFYAFGSNTNITAPVNVLFDNVEFVANAASTTAGAVYACSVVYALSGSPTTPRNLVFRACKWSLGTTNVGDTFRAILVSATTFANGDLLTVEGGSIPSTFTVGIQFSSGGRLVVGGGLKLAAPTGIQVASTVASGRQYDITIGQINVASTVTAYLLMENSDPANIVRHVETVLDESLNLLGTVSGWNLNTPAGRRVIMMTAAPTTSTKGIKGDVARLKTPVAGAVYEWVCTAGSSTTSNVWKAQPALAA